MTSRVLTKEEKDLIADYVYADSSDTNLVARVLNYLEGSITIIDVINKAIADKDADILECVLYYGEFFDKELNRELRSILCNLAKENWHELQETIVFFLEDAKEIRSLQAIYQIAISTFDHLDFSDNAALTRKCVWALIRDGSNYSVEILNELIEKKPYLKALDKEYELIKQLSNARHSS